MKAHSSLLTTFAYLAIAGVSIWLTGCESSTKSEDDASASEDNLTAVQLIAGDIASDTDGEFTELETIASYESGSVGKFGKNTIDTVITRPNMTISLYRKFASTTGDSTDRYVDGSSTSLVFKRSMTGVFSTPEGMTRNTRYKEINRYNAHTVTGLLPTETAITLNGNGTRSNFHEMKRTIRNQSVTDTFSLTGSSTRTNIVINKNDGDNWPESGTAVYNLTITKTKSRNDKSGERTFTRTITITYNGTETPDVTVNGESFKLGLKDGEVTKK